MHVLQLLLCFTVVAVRGSVAGPEARSATPTGTDDKRLQSSGSVGILDSVLRGNGKSRQSRCVRCYEDRYYSSDRYGGGSDRYGASDRYGGYASRAADDPRSSWYYSYDRYDDRAVTGRDRDYDRYYSRDDRYAPRGSTYDRYEGRGAYDDYRRGSAYDRGYGTGYGYASYDSRDRYYADRYSDSSRDRYYDRSRSGYGYDKYDPYDRYYSRGQSGFDNSGRGYYFAGDDDDTRSGTPPFYDRERVHSSSGSAAASPCGHLVANCPYADRGTKVSSSAIGSDGYRGGHTSIMGKPSDQGGWTYLGDQDKQSSRGGSSSNGGGSMGGGVGGGASSATGAAGPGASGSGGGRSGGGGDIGRDRERDAQSSSYGGRPRPLGGSYLFDRDSNAVPESPSGAANSNGSGGGGGGGSDGASMPSAAAQTASAPAKDEVNSKDQARQ